MGRLTLGQSARRAARRRRARAARLARRPFDLPKRSGGRHAL